MKKIKNYVSKVYNHYKYHGLKVTINAIIYKIKVKLKIVKSTPQYIDMFEKYKNFNLNDDIENKLEEKELKAKAHLEDMFDLTRNLSYSDIKLLKQEQDGKKQNKIEENQNENQRDF